MRPLHLPRLVSAVLVACVAICIHPAAAQTVPAASVEDRLNRIGADLYSATPRTKEAIAQLKAILADEPGSAKGHMLLGIAYLTEGSPDLMGEAVAELRQAVALDPSLALARLTLGRAYLDMARASRAREELQAALEQKPGEPQVLALLGEAERQLGNPARSAELTRQALLADPTLLQARYYLALALLDLRQGSEAIREMETVVKAGARAPEAYTGLGAAYLAAGRVDDALAALGESARIDPARAETRIQLSRAYRAKGRLADAARELKLAAPPAKADAGTLYHGAELDYLMEEGLLRLQQGRLQAAAASFQKVLDLDSSHQPAQEKLAEVRKRLKAPARPRKPGERS